MLRKVDLRARGIRTPMHSGLITAQVQQLTPWMVAPLRPNETLVGVRLDGHAFLNLMMKLGIHLPLGYELSMWKVPLSALGEEFVRLAVNDVEDVVHLGLGQSYDNVELPGALASQGHLGGTALGTKPRIWAGEIGEDATPSGFDDPRYARFCSAATWNVAQNYYDLELGETGSPADYNDPDLHDNPPTVADMIRGATYSGISAGDTSASSPDYVPHSPSIMALSVAQWAEALSLMTKMNLTYAEWLGQFGVPSSRVRTLPEPIVIRRGMLDPWGPPHSWYTGANYYSDPGANATDHQHFHVNSDFVNDINGFYIQGNGPYTSDDPDGGMAWAGDRMGINKFGAKFRITRQRRLIADEPCVILGLFCWWPTMSFENQYVHHVDMSQMTKPAHWGVPTGGLDEADFMTANVLFNRDADAVQAGSDEEAGIRAMNMLNLYVHGDSFCNDPDRFVNAGPFDNITVTKNQQFINMLVDVSLRAKLLVATDMLSM
jgi:hypothetical protein